MMRKTIVWFILLLAASMPLFSQAVPMRVDSRAPRPDWIDRVNAARAKNDALVGKDPYGMIADRPDPRIPLEPRTKPDGKPMSIQELENARRAMAPEPIDVAANQEILSMPKTGIFRIFPDFECESPYVVKVGTNCGKFPPGSWNYSLRARSYPGLLYSSWDVYDLRLSGEDLISDGFFSQSIMVALGTMPLDEVTLRTLGLNYLKELKPEISLSAAQEQYRSLAKTVDAGGFRYSKRVRAVTGITYAARFIAFHNQLPAIVDTRFPRGIGVSNVKWMMLNEYDKRHDMMVAFRVVRAAADGSLTIVWKELSRRQAPTIKVGPNDKPSDIRDDK